MAVNRVNAGVILRLRFQTGVDNQGNPVYRDRTLRSIDPNASDQNLFDVAQALANLQEYTLDSITRIQSDHLIQV
jgi:Protein of unknown function (DUF1659).